MKDLGYKLGLLPIYTSNHSKTSFGACDEHGYLLPAFSRSSLAQNLSKKRLMWSVVVATTIAMFSTLSHAGEELVHQDWQVACDNTLTCRLAGYQAENNSDFPVSVMLVRRAGSNEEVVGKVKLGGGKESSSKALLQLGNRHRMSLFINDKDLGETKPFSTVAGDAELTPKQVNALLEALTKSSKIELVLRNSRWQLSDKGATAVMLRADEVQGRVGTASALVGIEGAAKSNTSVPAPKPAPQLRLIVPNPKTATNTKKFAMKASQLTALVKGTIKNADTSCPNLTNNTPWRISRLSETQLLLQHNCWTGAYNVGNGIWVINDAKPHNPVLVTTDATNYDSGKISSVQKGRGIGDCLSKKDWIWTGKRFEKSHESSTGMCRMIEAGGAWQLPTYVSEVNTSQ